MSSEGTPLDILRKSPSVENALNTFGERSASPHEQKVEDFALELINAQESLTSADVSKLMDVEEKIAQSSPKTAAKICQICADLLVEKPTTSQKQKTKTSQNQRIRAPQNQKSEATPPLTHKMVMHMLEAVKESPDKTNKICAYYVKMLIKEDEDPLFIVFPNQIDMLFKDLDSHRSDMEISESTLQRQSKTKLDVMTAADWAERDFTAKMNVMTAIACLHPEDRAIAVEQLGRVFMGGYKGSSHHEKANLRLLIDIPKDPLGFIFSGPGSENLSTGETIPSGKEIKKRTLDHLKSELDSADPEKAAATATLVIQWQKSLGLQDNDPLLNKAQKLVGN